MKKIFVTAASGLSTLLIQAQVVPAQKTEMTDLMRDNGEIYVVVTVILTILTRLILYMIRLDRKMSRLEKNSL
jgi:tRNA(Phe) wybutosine-synthesizing methylase Tyw3